MFRKQIMDNDELLEFLMLTLFTEAKAKGKNNLGKKPMEVTGVSPDDIDEIDIVYEARLRIKCFYSSAQLSNNQTAFYLEIKENDLKIWQDAAYAFFKSKQTSVDKNKLQELRDRVGKVKKTTIAATPLREKGTAGW